MQGKKNGEIQVFCHDGLVQYMKRRLLIFFRGGSTFIREVHLFNYAMKKEYFWHSSHL